MMDRNAFAAMSDIPQEIYTELDELQKLRYRDRILSLYLHLKPKDLQITLMEDMKVCEAYEQYEVAQAYLDLINDLNELDLLY